MINISVYLTRFYSVHTISFTNISTALIQTFYYFVFAFRLVISVYLEAELEGRREQVPMVVRRVRRCGVSQRVLRQPEQLRGRPHVALRRRQGRAQPTGVTAGGTLSLHKHIIL